MQPGDGDDEGYDLVDDPPASAAPPTKPRRPSPPTGTQPPTGTRGPRAAEDARNRARSRAAEAYFNQKVSNVAKASWIGTGIAFLLTCGTTMATRSGGGNTFVFAFSALIQLGLLVGGLAAGIWAWKRWSSTDRRRGVLASAIVGTVLNAGLLLLNVVLFFLLLTGNLGGPPNG